VCGRVVELPVGARVDVGDRVEHPRVDAGVVGADGVSVVEVGAVGEVVGEAKSSGAAMDDVRGATDPALSEDDHVASWLRICGNAYVDADDHRRLNAAELDVYGSVVLQTHQRLRESYHTVVLTYTNVIALLSSLQSNTESS